MKTELALLREFFKKENIPEKIPPIEHIRNVISDIPRQIEILKQRFSRI